MKSTRTYLAFILLTAAILVSAGSSSGQTVSGQAVLKVASPGVIRSLEHRSSIRIIDSIPELRVYLVEMNNDALVDSVVDTLKGTPNVLYAEPNRICNLPGVQQVSIGFPDQDRPIFTLGEAPASFYGQPGVYNVGIDSAQQMATGEGVIVAVLDNGIKLDHPLMVASHILPGYDFLDHDDDPSEEDGYMKGHGTFVSGLVLRTSPGCTLLPIRVMSGDGFGCEFYISKALVWAAQQGTDVANLSFGSPFKSELMSDAVAYMYAHGVTMVASAGNDGTARPYFPAALDETMAIGAINQKELLADFSSFGKHLALVAPGVDMYSALAGEFEWGTWSGTSFSAPLVTGTVALILQIQPQLSPDQVSLQLSRTARIDLLWGVVDLPSSLYGAGVLNAYKALQTLGVGDIDLSGYTDEADLELLAAFVRIGRFPPGSRFDATRADINCDGKVNLTDLTILTALVNGLPAGAQARHCTK